MSLYKIAEALPLYPLLSMHEHKVMPTIPTTIYA